MNIKQNLVDKKNYNIKCPYTMNPEFIVVHNTYNDASAANEIKYMISNRNMVSFHFAVDDKEVIQGIPLNRNAYHAGDGANGKGNRKGISIEICYSKSGGDKFIKAEQNAAKLVAQLLHERNWGINKVTKHQDYSGKYCPHRTLDMGWQRFLDMVREELNALTVEKYSGYITILYNGLAIHNKPSWSNDTISGTVKKDTIYTVVGRIKVEGVYMYQLKSGAFITSASKYVKYSSTYPKTTTTKTPKVGSKVKVKSTAKKYQTGKDIPDWVKKQTYTVSKVETDKNRLLLKEITSWVYISDVTVQ